MPARPRDARFFAAQTAFIIGHELGHYLADHGGETRTLTSISSALQIVVLAAVDPTGARQSHRRRMDRS